MGGRPPLHDTEVIVRAANARAAEFAVELLPNGRRTTDRRHWETNSLDDNPRPDGGHSFKLNLTGTAIGWWRDFATGENGDIVDLVAIKRFGGVEHGKGEAFKYLRSLLGFDNMDPQRLEQTRYQARQAAAKAESDAEAQAKKRQDHARAQWLSGAPIAGTPAERYLRERGLEPVPDMDGVIGAWPRALRYHEEIYNSDAKVKLPCMLAGLWTADGTQVATHRTWLGRDGQRRWVKADQADLGVPRGSAKKVLGRARGGFVPIAKGASGLSMGKLKAAEPVFVTEGIEDALTVAMARPGARVVAGYSLDNIGAIAFPALIDPVIIVADRDEKEAAQRALERAIAKLQAQGKRVQLVMPPVGVKDINEWLNVPRRGQAA